MNFRNALIAAGASVGLLALATAASALSVQATAPASVTVISPVTITKTADMRFGNVVRPTSGVSTITLNANDAVTETGGGNGSVAGGLPTSSAQFDVAAPAGTTFTTSQGLAFLQSGLDNVTAATPVTSDPVLGTVTASGVQTLRYGGSFDMTPSTAVQAYTGTLTVTVNYN